MAHEPDPHTNSTALEFVGLVRSAIRTRESVVILSAWRLVLRSAQGEGTIDLVETGNGTAFYRGAGLFLGWPQADLESVYRRSRPAAPGPEPDPGQFG